MNLMMQYEFPGNVRELENLIEHAFVLCHGSRIKLEHLPREFVAHFSKETTGEAKQPDRLKAAEATVILDVLKKHAGNRKKAAEELGIDKSTLWRKLKKYKIEGI